MINLAILHFLILSVMSCFVCMNGMQKYCTDRTWCFYNRQLKISGRFLTKFLFLGSNFAKLNAFCSRDEYAHVYYLSFLNPLNLEVVWAPQTTLQQYFPFFPVFRCPQGISKPNSIPFLDVIFPSLLLSSSPSCSFHCPLQNCFRLARGS